MPVRLTQAGCGKVLVDAGVVVFGAGVVGAGVLTCGVVGGGVVPSGEVAGGVEGTAMQESALSCTSHFRCPYPGRGLMVHERLVTGLTMGS